MKKKIITRHTCEKLFNADIVLVVSEWEDFLTGAKDFLPPDKLKSVTEMYERHGLDKVCKATQFPFVGGGSIIWAHPKQGFGTLTHEITHAAHHLLKERDVPLSDDTEEVYAYLVEFLFNELIRNPK